MTKKRFGADAIGKTFGRLRILRFLPKDAHGRRQVLTLCKCGVKKNCILHSILSGNTLSCGCLHKEFMKNLAIRKIKEHLLPPNTKIGYLTILRHFFRKEINKGRVVRRTWYTCKCICGKIIKRSNGNFRPKYKDGASCGCKMLERRLIGVITHGASQTTEYKIWQGMKARCYNPKHTFYKRYGGRGIKMFRSWKHSFETFREYLKTTIGLRPSKSVTLDRIDNDRGYIPGNLRWATQVQQIHNQSKKRKVNRRK